MFFYAIILLENIHFPNINHTRRNKMAKRIFISFAIEDERLRDLLVGQARNKNSLFNIYFTFYQFPLSFSLWLIYTFSLSFLESSLYNKEAKVTERCLPPLHPIPIVKCFFPSFI